LTADPPDDLDFFLTLTLASSKTWPLVQREFEAAGVDPSNWGLLVHIDARKTMTPTQLAAEVGVTTTTMRDQLESLVDRGLIERRDNPFDARSYLVVLTRRGRRNLELGLAASQRARETLEKQFGTLELLRVELLRLIRDSATVLEDADAQERARQLDDALKKRLRPN
jgi:DNA-binding MarR family transcriptional regulator